MKNFFSKIKQALTRALYGCYGTDELGRFTLIAACVLFLISFIPYMWWSSFAGLAVLAWSYFRMFSKNHQKRKNENLKYLKLKQSIKGLFKRNKSPYRYYKCPKCKTKLRVPRGKGKIRISCNCGHKFIKFT